MTNADSVLDSMGLESLKVAQSGGEALAQNKIVGFDSLDRRSRPFSLMRTQVAKRLADENLRLLGVTSPSPAAGKSFLATNLAASLSRVLRVPTYLVDLDLRRGSVAQEIGIDFHTGVGDYLMGNEESLREVGLRIEDSRLAVFPTRASNIDSAQAIAGARFEALVRTLREDTGGAVVIFDLPPVFANDDAVLSTRALDGYIMVVDSGQTSRRQLTDAMDMLRPVPCVGTVLNRYSGGILDSYGYGSTAYEQYYSL